MFYLCVICLTSSICDLWNQYSYAEHVQLGDVEGSLFGNDLLL